MTREQCLWWAAAHAGWARWARIWGLDPLALDHAVEAARWTAAAERIEAGGLGCSLFSPARAAQDALARNPDASGGAGVPGVGTFRSPLRSGSDG